MLDREGLEEERTSFLKRYSYYSTRSFLHSKCFWIFIFESSNAWKRFFCRLFYIYLKIWSFCYLQDLYDDSTRRCIETWVIALTWTLFLARSIWHVSRGIAGGRSTLQITPNRTTESRHARDIDHECIRAFFEVPQQCWFSYMYENIYLRTKDIISRPNKAMWRDAILESVSSAQSSKHDSIEGKKSIPDAYQTLLTELEEGNDSSRSTNQSQWKQGRSESSIVLFCQRNCLGSYSMKKHGSLGDEEFWCEPRISEIHECPSAICHWLPEDNCAVDWPFGPWLEQGW